VKKTILIYNASEGIPSSPLEKSANDIGHLGEIFAIYKLRLSSVMPENFMAAISLLVLAACLLDVARSMFVKRLPDTLTDN
jgi:hypothetical protein